MFINSSTNGSIGMEMTTTTTTTTTEVALESKLVSFSSPLPRTSTLSFPRGMVYAPNFSHYLAENVSLFHLVNQSHVSGKVVNISGNLTELIGHSYFNKQDSIVLLDSACEENYNSHENSLSNTIFQTTVYFMYILIFVLALLGNGIVCYIVQSSPRMRTVTNYFIANLAIGDILMSLFCVPFSFLSILILGYWPFGAVMCHLVNYSQAISVLVSAYTLVAISVDRYIVIMWPLRPRITKRYAKCIIAAVWAIALVTAMPIIVVSKLYQPKGWHENCGKYICREDWEDETQYYYYTLALMGLQFVIPLSVLVFTYTRIAVAVWGKRPPGEAENSRDQRMARSKRKMIKMMVTVVIVFTMCWLPFNVLVLLLSDERVLTWQPLPYVWFACHWLAMSHSCYNPIIYCYMNARFRGGFINVIYAIPGVRHCWCVRRLARARDTNGNVVLGTNFALTGIEETSQLHRVNTCTTYISSRRKIKQQPTSLQAPPCLCAETALTR